MPDLHEGRRDTVLIITAMIMIKLASLAFIHAVVGGSVLEQLSTKWDSVYYVGIAQNGYPAGSVTANYAFAPGYPSLIWLASLAVGNYLLSAAIVSNVFSVLAVLAFYRLSRMYFGPFGSLCASLAFGFFPTFVTYGLVSYSEPVYLFFAILAVYFFLNARYFYTGVTSSLAVLSGYASLLIAPIFLSIIILRLILPRLKPLQPPPAGLHETESRAERLSNYRFVWLFMPLVAFGLWMYFLDVRSGELFSLFAGQAPWGTGIANPIAQFQAFFTGIFSTQGNPVQQLLLRYPYTLSFFALVYPLWKIDKALSIYSSAFMLFVLSLVGTAYMSGPRLMLSAWPVLLVFGRAKKEYIIPVLILFAAVSLQSTYAQLTSFWT